MEDKQPAKPRFALPSFKDVQRRGSEKAQLRSTFGQQVSGNVATTSGVQPSCTSGHEPAHSTVTARPPSTAVPSIAPEQHSVQNRVHTSTHVHSLPASSGTPQVQNHQAVNHAAVQPVPTTAPLQPMNTGQVTSTAYSGQIGYGNAILVNRNQQGNPVLKHIRNVNYRFADVVPDFQFNDQNPLGFQDLSGRAVHYILSGLSCMQTAAIFLSLKFHRLKPQYMATRIKMMKNSYRTILVCICDIEDPVNALAEVAQGAVDHQVTLIVAFSEAECARYLELLKVYENKQADALMPQTETDYVMRVSQVLTHVRAVNRTDSALMGSERRTLASILTSTEKDLSAVPGLGPAKVKRLFAAFNSPFYINQRKPEVPETADEGDGQEAAHMSENEAREWVATQQMQLEDASEDGEDM